MKIMKKKILGPVALMLIVLLVISGFLFAQYRTHFNKSEMIYESQKETSRMNEVSGEEISGTDVVLSDTLSEETTDTDEILSEGISDTTDIKEETSAAVNIKEQAEESSKDKVSLAVNVIYQYPDMPSGCEVTALTMVLNYMGINVTNKYLADNYLDSSTYDMFESFVGSVYDDSSFGCFAPVIVRTANDFFADNNYEYRAVNVSESTKEQLIGYLHDNKPVIIWNTENMSPTYTKKYNLDGYEFTWHANEHCVVLCGYNEEDNTFEIADSIAGKVRRDADTFYRRYEDMLSQAVIIN